MANKNYSNVSSAAKDDGGPTNIAEKGEKSKGGAPSFKETENPSQTVPKLPQREGAED